MPLTRRINSAGIADGSVATVDLADGAITAAKLATPLQFGTLTSGNYYFTAAATSAGTSATLNNGSLRVAPWFVPNACTLTRIGAEITIVGEAASTLRLGIYSDSGAGVPGTLLVDAGTIAGDSATVQEVTISQAVTPGLYWVGAVLQGAPTTQPTIRVTSGPGLLGIISSGTAKPTANQGVNGLAVASISGALPSTATWVLTSVQGPRIFVKIA